MPRFLKFYKVKPTSKLASPNLWLNMYDFHYISVELKNELIEEFRLQDKVDRMKWFLMMRDGCCYLICIIDGMEYINMGLGWSFAGRVADTQHWSKCHLIRVK